MRMMSVSVTPPKKPATAPEEQTDDQRDRGGDDADPQRHPGAVDHPAEHVAADGVGAEPVIGRRGLPVLAR